MKVVDPPPPSEHGRDPVRPHPLPPPPGYGSSVGLTHPLVKRLISWWSIGARVPGPLACWRVPQSSNGGILIPLSKKNLTKWGGGNFPAKPGMLSPPHSRHTGNMLVPLGLWGIKTFSVTWCVISNIQTTCARCEPR